VGFLSFAISGTTTFAASDTTATSFQSANNGTTPGQQQASTVSAVAITAGSNNTFTLQYKETGGSATFSNRTITVIPLN
jgi:hypothetical protein